MSVDSGNSIRALKGAERVRKRPGVMFGSDNIEGAFHTVKELLGNALDEARAGYGKHVKVIYHSDKSISIEDEGRGIPMGWNESENRYNWDLLFNELYAGGKYDDDNEEYEFTIGLNGLGLAATQYVSEWMTVISKRKEGVYRKSFSCGSPLDYELNVESNESGITGTEIRWKIDNSVFPDTDFKVDTFKTLLESQAHINAINLTFVDEESGESFEYEGKGIESYLKDLVGDKLIDIMRYTKEDTGEEAGKNYHVKSEIVLAITDDMVSKRLFFHNTGQMETGVHFSAFTIAITDFFKNIAKMHNIKIEPYDYNDYISVIVSTYSNISSPANQTKNGVSNPFILRIVYDSITEILEDAYAKNRSSIAGLINNVVSTAVARKKAKELEMQERALSKITANSARHFSKPPKYVDCESDRRSSELWIIEGDSALGACQAGRDKNFQALFPLKGKLPNCLKTPIDTLIGNPLGKTDREKEGNKEIKGLINLLGVGINIDGVSKCNPDKLNYNKVIIATDADIDGYQIRVLVFTFFMRFMPELLNEDKVFIVETPLFTLNLSNGDVMYAYTPEERVEIEKELASRGIRVEKIERSKGLGENNADVMWDTTMNPENRRLISLKMDTSLESVRGISNMLFGLDTTNGRKDFILSLVRKKLGLNDEIIDGLLNSDFMGDLTDGELVEQQAE